MMGRSLDSVCSSSGASSTYSPGPDSPGGKSPPHGQHHQPFAPPAAAASYSPAAVDSPRLGELYSPAASNSDVSSIGGGLFSPGLFSPGLPAWADSAGSSSTVGRPELWTPFSEPSTAAAAAASYAAALSGLMESSGGVGGVPSPRSLFPGLSDPLASQQYLWSMYLDSSNSNNPTAPSFL